MGWADDGQRFGLALVFFILFSFFTAAFGSAQGEAAEAAGVGPILPGGGTVPPKGQYLLLNIASTTLYFFEDGRLIKCYKIGVGRTFEQTPLGDFKVVVKQINPTWYPKGRKPVPPGPANPLGTRWMGLGGTDYGIHGTNAPWTIGLPSSGGCIRLVNADAEELFERVKVGTPVRIVYETVEVVEDERTGDETLLVWADIYGRGQEPPEVIIAELEQAGRPGAVRLEDLREALARADGYPLRLPLGRPAELNGWTIPGGYIRGDGSLWVQIRPLAENFGREVVWDAQDHVVKIDGRAVPGAAWPDGRWRVKLEDLQGILGLPLAWEVDDSGRLQVSSLGLFLDDRLLTRQIVASGDDFLIPLRVANGDLGLGGIWDFRQGAVAVGGDYLPGAIQEFEPYVRLGPVAARLRLRLSRDDARLRLILSKDR